MSSVASVNGNGSATTNVFGSGGGTGGGGAGGGAILPSSATLSFTTDAIESVGGSGTVGTGNYNNNSFGGGGYNNGGFFNHNGGGGGGSSGDSGDSGGGGGGVGGVDRIARRGGISGGNAFSRGASSQPRAPLLSHSHSHSHSHLNEQAHAHLHSNANGNTNLTTHAIRNGGSGGDGGDDGGGGDGGGGVGGCGGGGGGGGGSGANKITLRNMMHSRAVSRNRDNGVDGTNNNNNNEGDDTARLLLRDVLAPPRVAVSSADVGCMPDVSWTGRKSVSPLRTTLVGRSRLLIILSVLFCSFLCVYARCQRDGAKIHFTFKNYFCC
jgi:hypothetical protein